MSRFKRWTVGVFSQLDNVVSKIENHDGLVSVSIRDAQAARARARVQMQRVHRDGERLSHQIARARDAETQWRERARRVGREDEARAVDCLGRSRRAASQCKDLENQLVEHERAEAKLRSEVDAIDQRIAELTRNRNLLRTRQSRAEALNAVDQGGWGMAGDVDEILERWEINVTTAEAVCDTAVFDADDLEEGFLEEEEQEELRSELRDLLDERER
jgi:phage shock protein A